MKKWHILHKFKDAVNLEIDEIIKALLKNRNISTISQIKTFLNPSDPYLLKPQNVNISSTNLEKAISRIKKALKNKEKIVVYADYDADGITAGAIMWETLYKLGANVMPFIPLRSYGYGFSKAGLDEVQEKLDPTLIISVDHGISAYKQIAYAQKLGMEVIVTDHHVRPENLPHCIIIHTTSLCGAGVSWFLTKELLKNLKKIDLLQRQELLALCAIGTIADLVPLQAANRALVKYGLVALNKTIRPGLLAIIAESGLSIGQLGTYEVSHIIAPRLNAMGRLVHALDALRLLCTKDKSKAGELAQVLGSTNRDRQLLTEETVTHVKDTIETNQSQLQSLLFVANDTYNPGVIGLVAGKLVESYYRPAIVVSVGETFSKASARSISGFNIIEAIRHHSELLVDAGGHPMAAGFTVETAKLGLLQQKLDQYAKEQLSEDLLTRRLNIDLELPFSSLTFELVDRLNDLKPYGMGNPVPVFITHEVEVSEMRLVGNGGKHLKMQLVQKAHTIESIAFNKGDIYKQISQNPQISVAYTLEINQWNGRRNLQLIIKDIKTTKP